MALYLKMDNLQGDVTNKAYKGYALLSSVHLPSVSNGTKNTTGSSEYHRGYAPQFAPIQIIKPVDNMTPSLFLAACEGRVFKQVTIVDTAANGDNADAPFSVITLTNVRIADYAKNHHSGVHPCEMLSLTYASISEKITGKNVSGSMTAGQAVGYDLEAIKAL